MCNQMSEEENTKLRVATMSSFAATKSPDAKRIICWPHAKNGLFIVPTTPDLPDPGFFSRMEFTIQAHISGFSLDIQNMFHNFLLP